MLYAAKTISVGVHPTIHVFGLVIDTDIVTSTVLAMAIFLFLGLRMVSKVTDGVPNKLQLFWEIIVTMVSELPMTSKTIHNSATSRGSRCTAEMIVGLAGCVSFRSQPGLLLARLG